MSKTIAPYTTPEEQRQQARTFIRDHIESFKFHNEKYHFLPITIIEHVASRSNILAVIAQDAALAADLSYVPDPSHSHDFLTNKLFNEAKRCFVTAMYAKQSMLFLRELTNHAMDEQLPLEELTIEHKYVQDLTDFMKLQSMFCAPVMKIGDYEQMVDTVPFVKVRKMGMLEDKEVFAVEFHEGHVVEEGERSYLMMACKDREEAEKTEVWERRKLGFWWEDEYFLCCE